MRRVCQRLFLILFPLSLLALAFWLAHNKTRRESSAPLSLRPPDSFLNEPCPFYLGLSFFPLNPQKENLFAARNLEPPPFWKGSLLVKKDFLERLKNFNFILKQEKLRGENALFTLPLALTKDKHWLVSRKTFLIFRSGERKELSHLSLLELKEAVKSDGGRRLELLTLEDALSYLPNKNFLFYLNSSNTEKVLEKLDEDFKDKTKGRLYLSSSNENLLKSLLALNAGWKALRSFKTLIRSQFLSAFNPQIFSDFKGRGILIPAVFKLSPKQLSLLREQNKLLFLEKDPPYSSESLAMIESAQALISSKPKLALRAVRMKKPCLIKNEILK